MRRLIVLALFAALSSSAYCHEYSAAISCKVESPVDGSLWIGTSGDGIFRIGRNGRRVWYSVESGHLTSGTILSMGFDNAKVLWILDGDGVFTRYTAVTGFEKELSFPEGITAAAFSVDHSHLYFATNDLYLYSYDISLGEIESHVSIPSKVNSLFSSVEVGVIWGLSQDGLIRFTGSGLSASWSTPGIDSILLPFEFDTRAPQKHVKAGTNAVYILAIISISLLIAFVVLLYVFLFRRRSTVHHFQAKSSSIVENLPTESELVGISSNTLVDPDTTYVPSVSGSDSVKVPEIRGTVNVKKVKFTKTVKDLIQAHLSDPGFDVDSIAAMTGLSRIHVNRKLKAEGSPSPSVLLKDARMALAVKLLKEGKLSVAQIGQTCGFSRPSYFATSFKDYYHVSPSDYLSTFGS